MSYCLAIAGSACRKTEFYDAMDALVAAHGVPESVVSLLPLGIRWAKKRGIRRQKRRHEGGRYKLIAFGCEGVEEAKQLLGADNVIIHLSS